MDERYAQLLKDIFAEYDPKAKIDNAYLSELDKEYKGDKKQIIKDLFAEYDKKAIIDDTYINELGKSYGVSFDSPQPTTQDNNMLRVDNKASEEQPQQQPLSLSNLSEQQQTAMTELDKQNPNLYEKRRLDEDNILRDIQKLKKEGKPTIELEDEFLKVAKLSDEDYFAVRGQKERRANPALNFAYQTQALEKAAKDVELPLEQVLDIRRNIQAGMFLSDDNQKQEYNFVQQLKDIDKELQQRGKTRDEKLAKGQFTTPEEVARFEELANAKEEAEKQLKQAKQVQQANINAEIGKQVVALETATGEDRIAIKQKIDALNASKKDLLKPEYVKVQEANQSIEQAFPTIDQQMPEGLTPHQKFDRYYQTLYQEYADLKQQLQMGEKKEENYVGFKPDDLNKALIRAGITSNEDTKRLFELEQVLRATAPIALLNKSQRLAENRDNFFSSFEKSFAQQIAPQAKASELAMKETQASQALDKVLKDTGLDKFVESETQGIIDKQAKEADAISFDKGWKDMVNTEGLGGMSGTSAGFILPFMIGTGAVNATKIGKALSVLEGSTVTAQKLNLMRSVPILRNAYGLAAAKTGSNILKQGVIYETTGQIFESQQEEANFLSGAGGQAAVEAIVGTGTGLNSVLAMFGNKGKVAAAFLSKMARQFAANPEAKGLTVKGLGTAIARSSVAEIPEETAQEFVQIYQQSDNFGKALNEFTKRYGTLSKYGEFALAVALSSGGMGVGSYLGENLGTKYNEIKQQLPKDDVEKLQAMVQGLAKATTQSAADLLQENSEQVKAKAAEMGTSPEGKPMTQEQPKMTWKGIEINPEQKIATFTEQLSMLDEVIADETSSAEEIEKATKKAETIKAKLDEFTNSNEYKQYQKEQLAPKQDISEVETKLASLEAKIAEQQDIADDPTQEDSVREEAKQKAAEIQKEIDNLDEIDLDTLEESIAKEFGITPETATSTENPVETAEIELKLSTTINAINKEASPEKQEQLLNDLLATAQQLTNPAKRVRKTFTPEDIERQKTPLFLLVDKLNKGKADKKDVDKFMVNVDRDFALTKDKKGKFTLTYKGQPQVVTKPTEVKLSPKDATDTWLDIPLDDSNYIERVANESTNPAEIESAIEFEKTKIADDRQAAIAEKLKTVRVKTSFLKDFIGSNNTKGSILFNYGGKDGSNLDDIADSLTSDYFVRVGNFDKENEGIEFTQQEIIDFISNNPNGARSFINVREANLKKLQTRLSQLTKGKPKTDAELADLQKQYEQRQEADQAEFDSMIADEQARIDSLVDGWEMENLLDENGDIDPYEFQAFLNEADSKTIAEVLGTTEDKINVEDLQKTAEELIEEEEALAELDNFKETFKAKKDERAKRKVKFRQRKPRQYSQKKGSSNSKPTEKTESNEVENENITTEKTNEPKTDSPKSEGKVETELTEGQIKELAIRTRRITKDEAALAIDYLNGDKTTNAKINYLAVKEVYYELEKEKAEFLKSVEESNKKPLSKNPYKDMLTSEKEKASAKTTKEKIVEKKQETKDSIDDFADFLSSLKNPSNVKSKGLISLTAKQEAEFVNKLYKIGKDAVELGILTAKDFAEDLTKKLTDKGVIDILEDILSNYDQNVSGYLAELWTAKLPPSLDSQRRTLAELAALQAPTKEEVKKPTKTEIEYNKKTYVVTTDTEGNVVQINPKGNKNPMPKNNAFYKAVLDLYTKNTPKPETKQVTEETTTFAKEKTQNTMANMENSTNLAENTEPKVQKATKQSTGKSYKSFRGLNKSSRDLFDVEFKDGSVFKNIFANNRQEAIEEAISLWKREQPIKINNQDETDTKKSEIKVENTQNDKENGTVSTPLRQNESGMVSNKPTTDTNENVPRTEVERTPINDSGQSLDTGTGLDDTGQERDRIEGDSTELDSTTDGDGGDTDTDTDTKGDVEKDTKQPKVNHVIADTDVLAENSPTKNLANNIEAIFLLKTLKEEKRQPTPEEKIILTQYVGWGGLPKYLELPRWGDNTETFVNNFLNGGKAYFGYGRNGDFETGFDTTGKTRTQIRNAIKAAAKERNVEITDDLIDAAIVKAIFTPKQYESAIDSTPTSHFTDKNIIKEGLWNIAKWFGFKGGNILEPAAGIGHIFGLMPQDFTGKTKLVGFELDLTQGEILRTLYPKATISITGFEKGNYGNNVFDLVITNVPFGRKAPYDENYSELSKFSLHDYFIAKSLAVLQPEGVAILITSAGSLDSGASNNFRKWAINPEGGNSDFMGAIRLPNNAFESNANTTVTSDILTFRKRSGTKPHPLAQDYNRLVPIREAKTKEGEPKNIYVNEYFAKNPDMMLGEMFLAHEVGKGALFNQANAQTLHPRKGENLITALQEAVKKLPQNIFGAITQNFEFNSSDKVNSNNAKAGALRRANGKVVKGQASDSKLFEGKKTKIGKNTSVYTNTEVSQELIAEKYVELKETLREVLTQQKDVNASDEQIEESRAKLNKLYDDFVKNYGHINEAHFDFLEDNDVEFALVASIENVKTISKPRQRKTFEYTKGDVFTKRVQFPVEEPTSADNLQDAINISISYRNELDIEFMAQLVGKTPAQVRKELVASGEAFINPKNANLETPEQYLSGNVREKLNEAIRADKEEGGFQENIKALEKVQPKWLSIKQISTRLGTDFVPPSVMQDFIADVLGIKVKVNYLESTSNWILTKDKNSDSNKNDVDFAVRSDKSFRSGFEVLESVINSKSINITYTVEDAMGNKRQVRDDVANAEAQKVAEKLQKEFERYLQENTEARDIVETQYNENFNAEVPRKYRVPNIDHYPNTSRRYSLRRHQKAAVARGLNESALFAHEVGTGKTLTMITLAMEMRRLGTAKKPMIVVQNATVGQFAKSFIEQYPLAKILVPSKADFEKGNRRKFLAKIATGDWDAVIIPQSQFSMLPDTPERVQAYIEEEIQNMQAAIDEVSSGMSERDRRNDPLIKAYEAEMEKLRAEAEKAELENLLYQMEIEEVEGAKEIEELSKSKGDKTAQGKKEAMKKAKDLAKQRLGITAKFDERADRKVDNVVYFEETGVDALLVDEAHAYKKLGFRTNMQNVRGIDTKGSKRSLSTALKTKYVQEQKQGKNVSFFTGTPISNTMAEAWTMIKYLRPDMLERYAIKNFDAFARKFGQVVQSVEMNGAGKLKQVSRFAKFGNVPELLVLWKTVTDVVLSEDIPEFKENNSLPKLKGDKLELVAIKQSKSLRRAMAKLKDRYEAWERLEGKEKREQSYVPLLIYGLAKRAAIDLRLIDSSAKDDEGSKTNVAVKKVFQIYQDSKEQLGTQLIFADSYQSSPSKDKFLDDDGKIPNPNYGKADFDLFKDIKAKLVKLGVPEAEIAIANDSKYDKPEAKQALQEAMQRGEVRIMLGSTEKMGVGINVQNNLIALHHLDAPARPMDFTQRNGRIIRQGNENKEVSVLTYGVEETLDAAAYNRLQFKQKFVNQMMKGDINNRFIEDPTDEQEASFAEIKAALSGSPSLQEKVKLDVELAALQLEKRAFNESKNSSEQDLTNEANHYKELDKNLAKLEKFNRYLKRVVPTGKITEITYKGKTYTEDLSKELTKILQAQSEKVIDKKQFTVTFNGIDFNFTIEDKIALGTTSDEKVVSYTATYDGQELASAKNLTVDGKGVMTSITNRFKLDTNIENLKNSLANSQESIDALKAKTNLTFDKDAEIAALKERSLELDTKVAQEIAERQAQDIREEVADAQKAMQNVPIPATINEKNLNAYLEKLTKAGYEEVGYDSSIKEVDKMASEMVAKVDKKGLLKKEKDLLDKTLDVLEKGFDITEQFIAETLDAMAKDKTAKMAIPLVPELFKAGFQVLRLAMKAGKGAVVALREMREFLRQSEQYKNGIITDTDIDDFEKIVLKGATKQKEEQTTKTETPKNDTSSETENTTEENKTETEPEDDDTTPPPTGGGGKQRERGLAKQIRTNLLAGDILNKTFDDNKVYYEQLSNSQTLTEAQADIDTAMADDTGEKLAALINKAKQPAEIANSGTAKQNAIGMMLGKIFETLARQTKDAAQAQEYDNLAKEILVNTAERMTVAGQAGQIGAAFTKIFANNPEIIEFALAKAYKAARESTVGKQKQNAANFEAEKLESELRKQFTKEMEVLVNTFAKIRKDDEAKFEQTIKQKLEEYAKEVGNTVKQTANKVKTAFTNKVNNITKDNKIFKAGNIGASIDAIKNLSKKGLFANPFIAIPSSIVFELVNFSGAILEGLIRQGSKRIFDDFKETVTEQYGENINPFLTDMYNAGLDELGKQGEKEATKIPRKTAQSFNQFVIGVIAKGITKPDVIANDLQVEYKISKAEANVLAKDILIAIDKLKAKVERTAKEKDKKLLFNHNPLKNIANKIVVNWATALQMQENAKKENSQLQGEDLLAKTIADTAEFANLFGLPPATVNQEMRDTIKRYSEEIKDLPEGNVRKQKIEEFSKALAKHHPTKFSDYFHALFFSSVLSGVGTQAINTWDNAWVLFNNAIAQFAQELGKIPKGEHRNIPIAIEAMLRGIADSQADIRAILSYGENAGNSFKGLDNESAKDFFNNIDESKFRRRGVEELSREAPKWIRWLYVIARSVSRLMAAADMLFTNANRDMHLALLTVQTMRTDNKLKGAELRTEVMKAMFGDKNQITEAAQKQAIREAYITDIKEVAKQSGKTETDVALEFEKRFLPQMNSNTAFFSNSAILESYFKGANKNEEGKKLLLAKRRAKEIILQQGNTEENLAEAREYAILATLKNEPTGVIGLVVKTINQALGSIPYIGSAFRLLGGVNFLNTMGNILNRNLAWTPLGFARVYRADNSAKGLPTFYSNERIIAEMEKRGIKSSSVGVQGSRIREQQLMQASLGTVGLALAIISYGLKDDDDDDWFDITGTGMGGFKERASQNERQALKSVHINKFPIPYQNAPMVAMAFSVVGNYADYVKKYGNKGDDTQARLALSLQAFFMGSMAGTANQVLIEGTPLRSISQALKDDSQRYEGDEASKIAKNQLFRNATGFIVPNFFKSIAKINDPTVYKSGDAIGAILMQTGMVQIGNLVADATGLDTRVDIETAMPIYDVFGRPVKTYQTEAFIPAIKHWMGTAKNSAVDILVYDKLKMEIENVGANTQIIVKGKKAQVGDKNAWYDYYARTAGEIFYEMLNKDYQRIDAIQKKDKGKAKDEIEKLHTKAKDKAKTELQNKISAGQFSF